MEMSRRSFLGAVASFAAAGRDILAAPPDEDLHMRFLGSGSAGHVRIQGDLSCVYEPLRCQAKCYNAMHEN